MVARVTWPGHFYTCMGPDGGSRNLARPSLHLYASLMVAHGIICVDAYFQDIKVVSARWNLTICCALHICWSMTSESVKDRWEVVV